ncbi:RNA polymerase II subunit A C-terminal domain phosphatase [Frankliniella fusca]|uniref:RNA polymerase II subunit A C-terminal domain phosphatase n=1 Tax=Frankliniella fusca TaxID=407009 RepID=A0AAE1L8B4_9NEOP|nr:RNA polymerase II subunit A C-terminal domain phosphatase [Frankliniella fusca]
MSVNSIVLSLTLENCIKISKWKVKEGAIVSIGRVILLYDTSPGNGKPEVLKLKATAVGTVRKLLAKEGDVVQPGHPLLELEKCTHPTVMKDMCAECGADLRNDESCNDQNVASIPMVHSIPELKVNAEQAQILGKADEERLLANKKLVLLVDLDQTLIHTTNDNIPPNLKDVYHFRLHGSMSPWHHTRLRPGTQNFLKEMSKYYELHICTFGSRMYAHKIAMFLDPDGQYFSHRILSRDECVSANSKTANLKALFPCGDDMVCIIDDREDVWNFAPNLIHVKPYHFFQHTGDINAPPGLSKQENDDKGEYDFSCLGDGKKGTDIFRPNNVDESSETSQCDAMDLVKKKIGEKNDQSKQESCESSIQSEEGSKEDSCPPAADSAHNIIDNEESGSQNPEEDVRASLNKDNKDMKEALEVNEELGDICKQDTQTMSNDTKAPEATEISVKVQQDSCIETTEGECGEPVNDTQRKVEDCASGLQYSEDKTEKSSEKIVDSKPSSSVKETGKIGTDEIEVPDHDDYLLYLEEILKRIHKEFYDRMDAGERPDMKNIIPSVRKRVLKGTNLVFSGLVPNNIPLEKSRAYQVAISLGACVTQDLKKNTTHLVAVRPGTAKVNSARRMKNVCMVTADWLWVSAERWERVDEKVFPLSRNRAGTRHPPPHCGSPEHTPGARENTVEPSTSSGRSRTSSGRFMDTINPLLFVSFSSDEIAKMGKEVDDISDDSESDGEEEENSEKSKASAVPEMELESEGDSQPPHKLPPGQKQSDDDSDSSSSSADSLSGEHPHGWGKHDLKRKRQEYKTGTATESDGDEEGEDMPSTKFRRGEALPSDLDLGENGSESPGSEDPPDPDEMDDGDWNMMGAALEREFLS